MTSATERRAAPRHPARANLYVLMVRAGAAARTCRIANFSRVGALVTRAGQAHADADRSGDRPRLASDVVLRFGNASAGRYHSVLARVQRIDRDGIALGFVDPLASDVEDLYRFALDAERADGARQPLPGKSEPMQMDFDESRPRLTVEPRDEPAPGDSGTGDSSDEELGERLAHASSRTTMAILIGLLVLAALAVFLAVRNYQLSAQLDRLEERVIALAAGPAEQANARIGALESRVAELQQAVSGLAAVAPAAGEVQGADGAEAIRRLSGEVQALKDDVASLSSRASAPVKKETAAPAAGGWIVQVASVKDAAEARELASRIERAGFDSETEKANIRGSTFHRVMATGFTTQDQARAAAVRLERDLGLDGAPWVAKR